MRYRGLIIYELEVFEFLNIFMSMFKMQRKPQSYKYFSELYGLTLNKLQPNFLKFFFTFYLKKNRF